MHGRVLLRKPLRTIIKSLGGRFAATPYPPTFLAQRSLFLPSQPKCQPAPHIASEDEFLATFDGHEKPPKPKKRPRASNVATPALQRRENEERGDGHAGQSISEETATELLQRPHEDRQPPSEPSSPSMKAPSTPAQNSEGIKLPAILQGLPPVVLAQMGNAVYDENLETVCFRHHPWKRSFQKLAMQEVASRETHESARRQERARMHPDSSVTLGDIKELLLRISAKGPGNYEQLSRIARVPEGHTAFFKDDPHEAALIISLHTSCKIELGEKGGYGHGFTTFGIRGTHSQVESAIVMMGRLAYVVRDDDPRTRLDFHADLSWPTQDQSAVDPPFVTRSYWWNHHSSLPLWQVLSRPRFFTWTTITFAEFISELTIWRSYSELRENPRNAGNAQFALNDIARELSRRLREAARVGSYLSSEAVTKAFTWLCLHTEHLPILRTVVNALERSSNYSMTAANYEVILDTLAREDDIHNFHHVLSSMASRGLQPTWRAHAYAYYIACLRDPEVAASLMRQMTALGVLADVEAVRHAAASTAYMLTRHFQDTTLSKSLDRILDRFDTLFDPRRLGLSSQHLRPRDWLSPENANRLADVFLLQGRTHDAFRMIEMLLDRHNGQKADRTTVNVFLRSAHASKDPARAVAILSVLKIGSPVALGKLDHKCWALLWRTAWRCRMHNMMRVIWRYACMHGQADWEFQRRIAVGLPLHVVPWPGLANLRGEETHSAVPKDDELLLRASHIWSSWISKFVLGVATGLRGGNMSSPLQEELVASASNLDPPSSQLESRYLEIFRADLAEAGFLMPVRPLYQALEEAYERDMSWGRPYPHRVRMVSGLTWADFKHLTPEERQSKMSDALQDMFRGMMEDAVQVEVRAGNARKPWERANLPGNPLDASCIHGYNDTPLP